MGLSDTRTGSFVTELVRVFCLVTVMYDLYMKVMEFLTRQYGYYDPWICRRVLMCLESGQFHVEQSDDGDIELYCGWWLINPEDMPRIAGKKLIPDDVASGSMVWVMDAGSVTRERLYVMRPLFRKLYPVSSGKKGIAWLRNEEKLVSDIHRRGIDDTGIA